MNAAEPIAIVGRGCVLPGCLTLHSLWQAIVNDQSLLGRQSDLLTDGIFPKKGSSRGVGGYIQNFDQVFDPERYTLGGIDAAVLDDVVRWPLHAVLNAWQEACEPDSASNRIGVVLANLSYPTQGKADYACHHWVNGSSDRLAVNAFNSGLPAHLIARALGATGCAFSLDAACASSLYALQIACQKLQLGSLDVAVVSAVNAAHDQMLQHGFGALQALSPTGRSQPFAASADGLVPAQGAAAVVLKRLRDVNHGEQVFGVIRAIGLSNDGRRGGFLVPDRQGQLEAMSNAFRQCDVDPDTINYLECHATGTPVGDSVEIQSASEFYARSDSLPVGSLKSNTGHLITVAGLASLLKLTLALEHETLPPTRIDGALNDSFEGSCLRPQVACEPWPADKIRRAAISNFGFGGNNAHLIMEEYSLARRAKATVGNADLGRARTGTTPAFDSASTDKAVDRLVICAIGALAGNDRGADRIVRRLMCSPGSVAAHCGSITLDPLTLRTPPADFEHVEPQQLALLAVVDDALRQLDIDELRDPDHDACGERLQANRIGVFAGMGCASDACRWLLRERLADYFGDCADASTIESLKDRVVAPMTAADVLGAMPNMPANRINAAYDFRGQGYTVSAEEFSDVMALQLGCEALRAHDLDLAVISAADFASEPVRSAALKALAADDSFSESPDKPLSRFTDKACALLLMRESTADTLGVTVLGTIEQTVGGNGAADNTVASADPCQALLHKVYGSAPIADTLFSMVVATALARRGQHVNGQITQPRLQCSESLRIQFAAPAALPGMYVSVLPWILDLGLAKATPDLLRPSPHLYYASAESNRQLCAMIKRRETGGAGVQRIAVIADSQVQLDERLEQAVVMLSETMASNAAIVESTTSAADSVVHCGRVASQHGFRQSGQMLEGIFTGRGTPEGELAFVYTGSAAAYPRMGRGLLMAHPTLATRLVAAFPSVAGVAHLLSQSSFSAYEELCAVTLLSQAHTLMLRDTLRLSPDAILGLSLGETNALYAFGLWDDTSGLLDDSEIVGMYEQQLGGEFRCASEAWGTDDAVDWTNWRIYSKVSAVEEALEHLPHTDVTIIYSDDDCIVGGPAKECQSLVDKLRAGSGVLMNQHLIVHTPTLQPYADKWRAVHTRPTASDISVRLYGHGEHKSYEPTRDNIADQLTRQALQTIDFRKLVEQAYADGVRTFIEVGPRDTLTASVDKILGTRPHSALAVDRIDQSDTWQLAQLAATLYADGHDVDIATLASQLDQLHHHPWTVRAARPSDINIMTGFDMPEWPQSVHGASMPCAPTLPAPTYKNYIVPAPAALLDVKSVAVNVPLPMRPARGPKFDRKALTLASRGLISSLFGDAFKAQDSYVRQVRLPAPPLLMVDRIVGIDAEPGVDSTGTIWTETDIKADEWYLHANAMRPGPLIESGQADLSLISWMGADFRNRDERVYRLLGCEMTVHDQQLPEVGDTLCYQIEITGHAEVNGIRLFFFQYDCRVDGRLVISVRHGQAGFFTGAELAASNGVLIDLASEVPATVNPPAFDITKASRKTAFSKDDLTALRGGNAFACFGEGFEHCAAHTNPPRLPAGKLELFDEVSDFDPAGGAWGRGYLQAVATVPMDAWFYDGHFHNDPCMPGTLMAEAAVQALECLAMAMGLGCKRDGWVFEPVPGASARFECRGQVIPDQQHVLTYDVHVDQIVDGDTPEVHAALVTSCDGFKVFYCPSFKIRLRRQWPAPSPDIVRTWIGPQKESRGDWHALLACGNGAPSDAFGDMYKPMDTQGLAPRLPQPPYHMISRVVSISTRPNAPEVGATVVTEYDVNSDAWYFKDGGNGQMPFAVLLEVALQPCGWLGSHGGFALLGGQCFRNLDGDGQIGQNIDAVDQCIRVEAKMTRFSTMGAMTIVHFDVVVDSSLGYRVMTLETSFGFFPMDALDRQVGLDINDQQMAKRQLPATEWPVEDSHMLLPAGQMLMVDKVDFFASSGGAAGLGLIRGYQEVDPYAWYFKAHFYQDPVQPGSLGLDALLQVMLRAIVLKGVTRNMQKPQVQYIMPEQSLRWSYRGQVTPGARRVTLVVEIESIEERAGDVLVTASGSLWRDELRIYEASNLSIGISDSQ
ncbi:MAG: beta-ketoacyl synthase N-terminal-like domain-containing protein [Granulosicoccus sp.]